MVSRAFPRWLCLLLACCVAHLSAGQELGGSCDAESLPRPQVDVAELSAQVCGLLTCRAVWNSPLVALRPG